MEGAHTGMSVMGVSMIVDADSPMSRPMKVSRGEKQFRERSGRSVDTGKRCGSEGDKVKSRRLMMSKSEHEN